MVRVLERLPAGQSRPLAVMILCALLCSTLAIVFGVLGALTYAEQVKEVAGLTLQHLRPLHTSFAVAWIYLAGVTVVYFFLFAQPHQPRGLRLRLKGQLILWGVAGGGVLVSLCRGVFSGREYMGAHWAWSVLIYLGWILFAWNFFSVVGFNLRGKPVFVYMWYTAVLLFLWTFAEGHGWHLALVSDYPLRDIAVQWKSYGPLVGSFNLLVYGAMGYLGCCVAGNMSYARSNTAFALFFVGVVNSFVNFGHHTYHLPQQSHLVKWISVIASLAEAVLAFKYMLDVAALLRSRQARPGNQGVNFIVSMTLIWSFILVSSSVIISIPPVNTLIHGTHFVMAHAMGAMLGVDSMALWAVLLFIIHRSLPADHRLTRKRPTIALFLLLNAAIISLVCVLATKGVITGYLRYMGPAAPAVPRFMTLFPMLFMACGFVLAAAILFLNINWMIAVLPIARKSPRPAAPPPVGARDAASLPAEQSTP